MNLLDPGQFASVSHFSHCCGASFVLFLTPRHNFTIMSRIPVNASLLALAVIAMVGICSQGVSGAANNCDIYVPTAPTGQTGPAYTTLALAVTAASNGDVICVAAGVYNFAYFNLATKGLTLQGAQAGVDARTRTAARDWVTGPYPAGETVFTHDGGHFVTIVGGLGATVDGIFVSNTSKRAQACLTCAYVHLTHNSPPPPPIQNKDAQHRRTCF